MRKQLESVSGAVSESRFERIDRIVLIVLNGYGGGVMRIKTGTNDSGIKTGMRCGLTSVDEKTRHASSFQLSRINH